MSPVGPEIVKGNRIPPSGGSGTAGWEKADAQIIMNFYMFCKTYGLSGVSEEVATVLTTKWIEMRFKSNDPR